MKSQYAQTARVCAALRKKSGYRTQRAFASALGVPDTVVKNLESGRQLFTSQVAFRMFLLLGIDPSTLLHSGEVRYLGETSWSALMHLRRSELEADFVGVLRQMVDDAVKRTSDREYVLLLMDFIWAVAECRALRGLGGSRTAKWKRGRRIDRWPEWGESLVACLPFRSKSTREALRQLLEQHDISSRIVK